MNTETTNENPLSVNDLPLYKRLNEQRTMGDWKTIGDPFKDEIIQVVGLFGVEIFDASCMDYESNHTVTNSERAQRLTNAQYACLAVNNLHILAEALEFIKNHFIGKDILCISREEGILYEKAKVALALIS